MKMVHSVLCGAIIATSVLVPSLAGAAVGGTQITPRTVYDLTPAKSKAVTQHNLVQAKGLSANAITPNDITCNSATHVSEPLFSTYTATSTSDSTANEDMIYAKDAIYNGSGGLVQAKADTENNTTHAGATATNTDTYTGGDYANGSHTYQKSGYQTIYANTQDTF